VSYISESFGVSEVKQYRILGRFIRIISGDVAELRLKRGGRYIDEDFQSISSGFSWEALPGEDGFDEVEVRNTASTQTIRIAISTGKVGFADSVTITGTAAIQAKNGTPSQAAATVTSASAQLLAANANRRFLLIQNKDASGAIYLNFAGAAATLANGIKIGPGEAYESSAGWVSSAAIYAIGDIASNANIVIVEGA
jgi:hypothetical protein